MIRVRFRVRLRVRFRVQGRVWVWSGLRLVLGFGLGLEWPVPFPTPTASLSLVPPLPVYSQGKLQAVWNRRIKVLILEQERLLVKWLEWRTRAQGDEKWGVFSKCFPITRSSMLWVSHACFRCRKILLNLEMWDPWNGTTQYYIKGSAFAHPTSPNLSAPRVSSLMSHSAVGLDMVNPGCITAPERIL